MLPVRPLRLEFAPEGHIVAALSVRAQEIPGRLNCRSVSQRDIVMPFRVLGTSRAPFLHDGCCRTRR